MILKRYKPRKKRSAALRMFILWLSFTVALGLMGGVAAAWRDDLRVVGTVSTGYLDLDVTTSSPYANVCDGGKNLCLTVVDASPGECLRVDYTVTNYGSIPVRLVDENIWSGHGCWIENDFPSRNIEANGDSAHGCLKIQLPGLKEDGGEPGPRSKTYQFDLELLFRQWNLAPGGRRDRHRERGREESGSRG